MRHTHLPLKSDFSSDFGHFILKILKFSKILFFQKKNLVKNDDFGADVPLSIQNVGGCPSSSPEATPKSTGECLYVSSLIELIRSEMTSRTNFAATAEKKTEKCPLR